MTRSTRLALLGMALSTACFGAHAYAAETMQMDMHGMTSTPAVDGMYEFTLDEVIVTGYRTATPLTLSTDPQRPRQPIPAADGAGYLKTIPGFSVVRKGGLGGDPMMRGMSGSRMVMDMNGGGMSGGCPNRMDPTSTYAFPETFSRIIVNKGPQSVRYGASVAGSVIFERETERFEKPGVRGNISVLGASNHRFDELTDVTAGGKEGYAASSRRGTIRVTTRTAMGGASTRATAATASRALSVSRPTPTPSLRSPTTAAAAGRNTRTA